MNRNSDLHVDTTLKLLTNRNRRRLLLSLLARTPDSDGASVLLDTVAADASTTEIQLLHVHLPMLADAGVVEWAPGRREVATGDAFDDLRPVLELLDENADQLPDGWL